MHAPAITLRPATLQDAKRAQELRKMGWQDNYAYMPGGATKEVLASLLAQLPPSDDDLEHFKATIKQAENADKNLVAVIDNRVVGVVFYETLKNGHGHAGVFVDREYRGQGIGSQLLRSLIAKTTNTLEVVIFARNSSLEFYKQFGFVESGPEFLNHFSNGHGAYLPAQRLILDRDSTA